MNIIETNLKWNGTFIDGENKPARIVLHHAEALHCTIQDIHAWHLANGWAGCGYHYLVRKDGTIYRGRKEGWRGSHCPNANYDSIGICFEGDFMKETMGETQIKAGQELVADIKKRYGITSVVRHKDLYATECPGTNFPFSKFNSVIAATKSKENIKSEGYEMKTYKNGSTPETVYQTSKCAVKIGSLDPYEQCQAIADVDGKIVVLYNTANGKKVGFVKYRAGL